MAGVTPCISANPRASIGKLFPRKLSVFCQRVLAKGLLDETVRQCRKNNYSRGQLLAFYLSDAGYETSRAGNLAQGRSKALAECPVLIVTDLYPPDMNPVDATVIPKQDPATSGIPIVVLTAIAFGEWKTKALKAGVAKYFNQARLFPELTEAVPTLIQRHCFLTESELSSLTNQERHNA